MKSAEVIKNIQTAADMGDFKRLKGKLVRECAESVLVIGAQRSVSSNKLISKISLNYGVQYKKILANDDTYGMEHLHFWRRSGLVAGNNEKWWVFEADAAGSAVGNVSEMADEVMQHGLPLLHSISTVRSICSYWDNGGYGGLTHGRRERFIEALCQR